MKSYMMNKWQLLKLKMIHISFLDMQKKSSICGSNIGPLLDPSTNCVTDDKFLMCKLLVDQFNSVFTIPDQSKIVTDPEVFFSVDEESAIESPHLSNIGILFGSNLVVQITGIFIIL